MRKKQIAKKIILTFFDVLSVVVVKTLDAVFEILGGLLTLIATILGLTHAPETTGNIIVASRQRKQRKQIEALQDEIDALKKK